MTDGQAEKGKSKFIKRKEWDSISIGNRTEWEQFRE